MLQPQYLLLQVFPVPQAFLEPSHKTKRLLFIVGPVEAGAIVHLILMVQAAYSTHQQASGSAAFVPAALTCCLLRWKHKVAHTLVP